MVSPNLPSKEELLQQHEFYDAASAVLQNRGAYRSDGTYAWGSVPVIMPDSVIDGRYRLTDYDNYCLRGFNEDQPARESTRLLEAGKAILSIQLYDQARHDVPISYFACNPSDINPHSTIGWYFYPEEHIDTHGSTPPVPEWHANELIIVQSVAGICQVITDITREEQLQHLLRTFKTA